MKKYYVCLSTVMGYIAHISVSLSPYLCPEGLETVLNDTKTALLPHFKTNPDVGLSTIELDEQALGKLLDDHFISHPQVQAWNERKNGNQEEYKFVSRHSQEGNPDDDFIDLGALRRGILNQFKWENARNESFDEKFNRDHPEGAEVTPGTLPPMRVLLEAPVYPSTENTIVSIVTDDKFHGAHNYEVKPMLRFEPGVGAVYGLEGMPITFVKKNEDGTWQMGLQTEQLLLLLIDRHNKMNAVFPSEQHAFFISYLESALGALQARVINRTERKVMGEHKA